MGVIGDLHEDGVAGAHGLVERLVVTALRSDVLIEDVPAPVDPLEDGLDNALLLRVLCPSLALEES